MEKNWSYFIAAVCLITVAKLIEIFFYEQLKPYHSEKDYTQQQISTDNKPSNSKEKVTPTIELEAVANETGQEDEKKTEELPVDPQKEEQLSGDDYFQNLKNAYLSPILAEVPQGRSREDVVVRYYKHNKDNDKVYALKALGYYLHEKEAEDSKEYGSNVLYYGSDVDLRDIQIVAYTLLQNGVPLRAIEPSQFDWKYHSLEIGADSLLEDRRVLSIDKIISLKRD